MLSPIESVVTGATVVKPPPPVLFVWVPVSHNRLAARSRVDYHYLSQLPSTETWKRSCRWQTHWSRKHAKNRSEFTRKQVADKLTSWSNRIWLLWRHSIARPRKPPVIHKDHVDISYIGPVMADFVPNFVAMATGVGHSKIFLVSFNSPTPKTPCYTQRFRGYHTLTRWRESVVRTTIKVNGNGKIWPSADAKPLNRSSPN